MSLFNFALNCSSLIREHFKFKLNTFRTAELSDNVTLGQTIIIKGPEFVSVVEDVYVVRLNK